MIIRYRAFLLMGLLTCFSLSSCFDIVEEINLTSRGTGHIKATLNLSKSKTKVASLLKLDKIDHYKIPSESDIRREMSSVVHLLRQTPGISNIRQQLDMNNYIASLSCDFADIDALNAFTRTLSTHFKTDFNSYSSYAFDTKTRTLTRNHRHSPDAKVQFDKLSSDSKRDFQDAFYTSIYRFDHSVRRSSNPNARISANGQAVMLKTKATDLINGNMNLSNTINLKN